MLLTVFTSCFKASSFWDLSGQQTRFPKPQKRGCGGSGWRGLRVFLPSTSPGAPLTWLLKDVGSASTVLDPELLGQEVRATCAFSHLARPAPGRGPTPCTASTRDPAALQGARRSHSEFGGREPLSPARRREAEPTKGLPKAERGNWHPMGPELPGTLGAARPALRQRTLEGL